MFSNDHVLILKEILLYKKQFFKMYEIFDHFFFKCPLEKTFSNVQKFYDAFKILRKLDFVVRVTDNFALNPKLFVLKKDEKFFKIKDDKQKKQNNYVIKDLLKIKETTLQKLILKEQKITLEELKKVEWNEEELKKVREKFNFYLKKEF